MISRTADGKTILYSFNGENRLIAIEPQTPESGDLRVTMLYDYMGRRVEKKAYSYNGSDWTEDYTKHFLYDGWNLVKESTTENSITTATYYTWGLDLSQNLQGAGGIGGLIATVSDTDTNYHCYDLNGNKTQLLSETDGTITAHIEYDPFGNEITSYGLSPEDDPFRFSTKYHDPEYDLYYYGYRYYLPDLGRWLNRDSIAEAGGYNLYCFAKNNSINYFDVNGQYPLSYDEFFRQLDTVFSNTWRNITSPIITATDKVWDAIKSVISKGWQRQRTFIRDRARYLPAVGLQVDVSDIVGLVGFVKGSNVMFFPETCEIAGYHFINGTWSSDRDLENTQLDSIRSRLAKAVPVGYGASAGAEYVFAYPLGSEVHNAKSWTGWFYNVMVGYGIGGGSVFWSTGESAWLGMSIGPGAGFMGGYSATYYTYMDDVVYPWKIEDTCLCDSLRYLLWKSQLPVALLKEILGS